MPSKQKTKYASDICGRCGHMRVDHYYHSSLTTDEKCQKCHDYSCKKFKESNKHADDVCATCGFQRLDHPLKTEPSPIGIAYPPTACKDFKEWETKKKRKVHHGRPKNGATVIWTATSDAHDTILMQELLGFTLIKQTRYKNGGCKLVFHHYEETENEKIEAKLKAI